MIKNTTKVAWNLCFYLCPWQRNNKNPHIVLSYQMVTDMLINDVTIKNLFNQQFNKVGCTFLIKDLEPQGPNYKGCYE